LFIVIDLRKNKSVLARFVSDRSKKKLESSDEDDKESNQHDYDEDNDQLEIEQEEKAREINGITINQVF
jgi:hypothetical protein